MCSSSIENNPNEIGKIIRASKYMPHKYRPELECQSSLKYLKVLNKANVLNNNEFSNKDDIESIIHIMKPNKYDS